MRKLQLNKFHREIKQIYMVNLNCYQVSIMNKAYVKTLTKFESCHSIWLVCNATGHIEWKCRKREFCVVCKKKMAPLSAIAFA